jgi:hypothetical protein
MRGVLRRASSLLLTWLLVGCSSAAPAAPTNTRAPAPTTPPASAATPAAAASSSRPSSTPLSPPVHVSVGDNQTLGVADVYIALDRGYDQQEGLPACSTPSTATWT